LQKELVKREIEIDDQELPERGHNDERAIRWQPKSQLNLGGGGMEVL
jgi:hypothetical protein